MKLSRRLTHRAKSVLPQRVQSGARRLIARWGVATEGWRMLPTIVVVGAQRSGTTTLFRLLSDHPQILRPTVSKGMAYFDLNYQQGLAWYRGRFPLRRPWARLGGSKAKMTFESSGYYMFHPLAAQRIARDLPDAKVIVMLRNPVDRAYSAHRHELRRGFETEPFETAIDLESTRLDGEVDRILADPTYHSFDHQHHAYLARGEYAQQVRRLFATVGRDNTYVIDADDFFSDPSLGFTDLCAWLGLEAPRPSRNEVWNAQPREPMPDELRERLMQHFEESDRALADLLGRTPSWRSGGPLEERRHQSL